MKPQVELPTKRPYQSPQLYVYGNISTLTQSASQKNTVDNSFLMTKT